MILSDNETRVDLLNNEPIAKTIVMVLRKQNDRPVTIGVHGDWGAGKSSILEMIEAELSTDQRVLCLKFNGWRFQGFEDAKIALIEGIVTGLLHKRPLLTRANEVVKRVLGRIDILKLVKRAGGIAVAVHAAHAGIPPMHVQALVTSLEAAVSDSGTLTKENVDAAIDGAKDLLKAESEAANVPKEIAGFRKAFDDLLKEAAIDQLIVLIDDLDRCLPDTAIETLEAVRLFIFTSRTAFVVAVDEPMIEYAVRKHFPDLPETTGPQTYARNYLEKLIQVPFRIPALGETETRIYVTLLLIGAELGEDDPAFGRLVAVARERLKRPWMGSVLDPATVKSTLAEQEGKAMNALLLSMQIAPILASGTKGNPRQIKRFLNTLLLRQASAEARGFGDDVRLPVLAKLMLAERFLTRVFDQVAASAASSSDGICLDLAALELAVGDKGKKSVSKMRVEAQSEPKAEASKIEESAQLGEWLSSPATRDWARVPPQIGDIDLRPYLFVAKERKDYWGPSTILGQIASVAEKLLGPKLAVQVQEAELRSLAPPEAAQVFDVVRGRIIGADTFDSEPAGAVGLAVLVKAQPKLQANLLDFLESLPRNRTGAWACSGWEGVIRDPEMVQRLERLLDGWSRNGGEFLRPAAGVALRMRKQGVR